MDIFYYSSGGNSKVFAEKLSKKLDQMAIFNDLIRVHSKGGPHQQFEKAVSEGRAVGPWGTDEPCSNLTTLAALSSVRAVVVVPAYGQFSYEQQKVINLLPKPVEQLVSTLLFWETEVYVVALGNRTFGPDYNGQISELEKLGVKIIGSGELTGGEELVQQVANKIKEIENEHQFYSKRQP